MLQTILDGDIDGLDFTAVGQVAQAGQGKLQLPSNLLPCGLLPPLNTEQSSADQRAAALLNNYDWVRR